MIKKMIKKVLPKMLPKGMLIWKGNSREKKVVLTFDDGPHPVNTEKILAILKLKGVKATFFLVGDNVLQNQEVARRILAEGHTIGSHTLSHKGFRFSSAKKKRYQINRGNEAIMRITGVKPMFFRPPQGALSLYALYHCFKRGQATVLWSVDSLDYRSGTDIKKRLRSITLCGGDIILMHEDVDNTIRDLGEVIDIVRSKGFGFVTLREFIK